MRKHLRGLRLGHANHGQRDLKACDCGTAATAALGGAWAHNAGLGHGLARAIAARRPVTRRSSPAGMADPASALGATDLDRPNAGLDRALRPLTVSHDPVPPIRQFQVIPGGGKRVGFRD